MLIKKLIPAKFLFGIGMIILSGILLSTQQVYPSQQSSSISFIIGCILIIFLTSIQIIFTMIGINISNLRINFQNMIFNGFAFVLLVWFALSEWEQKYVWYIWGFFCLYPFFNQLFGMFSVLMHSKKVLYVKYRADQ